MADKLSRSQICLSRLRFPSPASSFLLSRPWMLPPASSLSARVLGYRLAPSTSTSSANGNNYYLRNPGFLKAA